MTLGRTKQRRAYASTVAILTLAVIAAAAVVLARFATIEIVREQSVGLEATGEFVAESARAWSVVHCQELRDGIALALPTGDLLPAGTSGQVTVMRSTASNGAPLVECRITLARGGQSLKRTVYWPVAADSTTRPGPSFTRGELTPGE